jgi:hypothetical protein
MAFDFATLEALGRNGINFLAEHVLLARVVLADAYAEFPVIVIALAIACMAPLLGLAGLLLPRRARPPRGSADTAKPGSILTAEKERARGVLRLGATVADPRSGPIRIGSDPSCHMRVDGPGIEPLHALITRDHGPCFELVRLASEAGVSVYVDGKTTARRELAGGETIKIGHNILVFDTQEATSAGPNQHAVEAANNPVISAVSAARLRNSAKAKKRATWRAEETAGGQADHSSVH